MGLQPAETLKNLKVLTSIITDFSWNPCTLLPQFFQNITQAMEMKFRFCVQQPASVAANTRALMV